MTDFHFESEKIDNPEIVSEFEMEDYEKYRLKNEELTIDLAIIDLEDRNPEKYIEQRKNELSESKTEVPHPYKAEKEVHKDNSDKIEFSEREGEGIADPEYNLIQQDGEGIARYKYRVFWREFQEENILCEVEIYIPEDANIKTGDIANSLTLNRQN